MSAPLTATQLADAFEAMWNAALGVAIERQEGHATASMLAEGFAAMARELRHDPLPAADEAGTDPIFAAKLSGMKFAAEILLGPIPRHYGDHRDYRKAILDRVREWDPGRSNCRHPAKTFTPATGIVRCNDCDAEIPDPRTLRHDSPAQSLIREEFKR